MKAQVWDGYKVHNFETIADAKKYARIMVFLTGETWYVGKATETTLKIHYGSR